MISRLAVHTLGPYRLLLAGQPVTDLTSRTAEALLIYLMRHPRPIARDVLADFFWDERDAKRAAANLRTVLTLLRKSLGDYLIITRHTVAFDHHADYWWDLAALEAELAQLEPALSRPETPDAENMVRLDAALSLVQGDFLEGFHLNESRGFEEWLNQVQNQTHRLVEHSLQRLVEACLAHGEYRAGIAHADRLLMLDPYNEAAHRQMMWLLARSGQRQAALAHYAACSRLLQDEVGVGPEELTNEVYHRILALPSVTPRRLPLEPTPFVGRDGEAEEIARRLRLGHCRLLTLLGPGGMGKSRLALRTAELLAGQGPGAFLDGIYFVPLSNAGSAGALAVSIADSLGLALDGAGAPNDMVRQHLHARELLLVLDSMEHLVDDDESIDQIVDLLNHAPGLKLLVTSRVRLRLQEEWLYDVAGLDYPRPEAGVQDAGVLHASHAPQPLAVTSYAAGLLFVQHARRLRRDFPLVHADTQAIAQICRLLDGQPLGLELAAAWTRVHTCPEIAQRIEQDLDFLNTELRNVPLRQRSLRAVFDYSWTLLRPDERRTMQQLAVFAGPVTVAVAQAISEITQAQMESLADHSLLRREPDSQAFTMHDTVRQYALEKLAAHPELDTTTWQAYCAHFAEFVRGLEPQLHGAQQLAAQAAMHRERANIRAAWHVSIQHGWWRNLDLILDGYYWYLWRRSEMQEARALFRAALAALGALADATQAHPANAEPTLTARLQSRLADAIMWSGDYMESRRLLDLAQGPLQKARAWADLGWLYDTRAQLEYYQSHFGQAVDLFEQALGYFRRTENGEGIAHTLCALANAVCEGEADYTRGRALYAESLREYRLSGDRYGQAKVTINMGATLHGLGRHAEALPYYEEGMALCRDLDNRRTLAIVLNNMGQVHKVLGNPKEALQLLNESAALRRELGDPRGLVFTLLSLADLAGQQQDYVAAYVQCTEALRLGLRLGAPAIVADVLVAVADIFAAQGRVVEGATLIGVVRNQGIEGRELGKKLELVLTRLESADKSQTKAGLAQARDQELIGLAHKARGWLQSGPDAQPAPTRDRRAG